MLSVSYCIQVVLFIVKTFKLGLGTLVLTKLFKNKSQIYGMKNVSSENIVQIQIIGMTLRKDDFKKLY